MREERRREKVMETRDDIVWVRRGVKEGVGGDEIEGRGVCRWVNLGNYVDIDSRLRKQCIIKTRKERDEDDICYVVLIVGDFTYASSRSGGFFF